MQNGGLSLASASAVDRSDSSDSSDSSDLSRGFSPAPLPFAEEQLLPFVGLVGLVGLVGPVGPVGQVGLVGLVGRSDNSRSPATSNPCYIAAVNQNQAPEFMVPVGKLLP